MSLQNDDDDDEQSFILLTMYLFTILRREDFLSFIDTLGDQQTPSWLGLPNNAEKVLLTSLGW